MIAILLALALLPADASAHGVRPGVLALEELEPGRFAIAWTPPEDSRVASAAPTSVRFPDGCARDGAILTCERGLSGTIAFDGVPDARTRIVVSIARRDGTAREEIVRGDAPSLDLAEPPGGSFPAWIAVGIDHVLSGLDHLAFVLGLLLVVGIDRRLVLTITAFTIAHSITLALAALDVVRLASAPVEACIALSVVLVAREASHDRPTLTRRAPWLVASIFGLVHGLGFAGALSELGLPRDHTALALLGFNVGVELGQLAVVAVAVAIARLVAPRLPRPDRARAILALAIGSLGAMWTIDRVVSF